MMAASMQEESDLGIIFRPAQTDDLGAIGASAPDCGDLSSAAGNPPCSLSSAPTGMDGQDEGQWAADCRT